MTQVPVTPEPRRTIGIIMGSTRPKANCRAITQWVSSLCRARVSPQVAYEIIDLAEWKLPLFDELGIPARDAPVHEHTKAWSQKVASLQGFIFVTPQYNWGYPAALKNALDFLFKEWTGKPAGIVAYGGHGGNKCAEQLQQVLTGLRMHVHMPPALIAITKEHQTCGITVEIAHRDLHPFAGEVAQVVDGLEEALCRPVQDHIS